MRYPKNQTIENQYTSGGEFTSPNGQIYKGYYWQFKNNYYIGKTPTEEPNIELKHITPETIKKIEIGNNISLSSLLILGKNTVTNIINSSTQFNSIAPQDKIENRYFVRKINEINIIIKEVDEPTHNTMLNNPIYQKLTILGIDIYQNSPQLDRANEQMPGIKTFLGF
jgi:hypothetical protein